MEEKELTESESLLLIRQMIQKAKTDQKDDGRGWIIYGWLLFLASVLTLFNLRLHWMNAWFFWNVFGLMTIMAMLFQTVRFLFFPKRQQVRTYTKDLFSKLNTGFFISLLFIIVAMNINLSHMIGFPLLISLYAFWILIYGSLLNFKPSIIGAYLTWIIGLTALFAKTFEQIMLLHALGVLVGYIIPGHIAYREFNQLKKTENLSVGV